MNSTTPFAIHVDWSRRIIRMTIRGYWDQPTLAAFTRALEAEEGRLRPEAGEFAYLCDARALKIQSKDVGTLWTSFLTLRNPRGLRTAVVVSSALSRLQIERVAGTSNRRVFVELGEALDWLAAGDTGDGSIALAS